MICRRQLSALLCWQPDTKILGEVRIEVYAKYGEGKLPEQSQLVSIGLTAFEGIPRR